MRRRLGGIVLLAVLVATTGIPVSATSPFEDTAGNVHEAAIDRIAALGITRGCNPPANTQFCPDGLVTRGEMAAFLVRTFGLTETGSSFTDTAGSVFATDIDRLATAGITRGCNPPSNTRFCPDARVTRGAMAAFLVRALDLTTPASNGFTDTVGHTFEADTSRLAAAGITRGCNPPSNTRFCPDQLVRRDEMATFLSRAADIHTTGTTPPTTTPTTTDTTSTPPTTGTTTTTFPSGWAARAPLPDDLTDAAGASLDGLLYLAGGKTGTDSRVDAFRSYSPATNQWTNLPDLPGPGREDVALVAAGDFVYVFGGASNDPFIGNVDRAARYSPAAGWQNLRDLLGGDRSGMAAVLYGGDIWLIGGFGGAGNSLASVVIYDIGDDSYSNGPALPSPRDHAGAAVVNGHLFVFGGRNRQGGSLVSEPTSVIRLTSPTDTTWSASGLDNMPAARRSFVVGTAANRVQLFGGESQTSPAISAVYEFNPATGAWSTSQPSMPTPRHGPAGATIGQSTYIVGGSLAAGSTDLTDVNERFTR